MTGAPADHLSSDQAKFYKGGTGWEEHEGKVEEFWTRIVGASQRGYSLTGTSKPRTVDPFHNKACEKGINAS